jgi:hypothetical protein
VLGQLAATGTADEVRAELARWDDVADIVVIGLPPGLPWEAIERTLRAAAPSPPVTAHRQLPTAELGTASKHTALTTTATAFGS